MTETKRDTCLVSEERSRRMGAILAFMECHPQRNPHAPAPSRSTAAELVLHTILLSRGPNGLVLRLLAPYRPPPFWALIVLR